MTVYNLGFGAVLGADVAYQEVDFTGWTPSILFISHRFGFRTGSEQLLELMVRDAVLLGWNATVMAQVQSPSSCIATSWSIWTVLRCAKSGRICSAISRCLTAFLWGHCAGDQPADVRVPRDFRRQRPQREIRPLHHAPGRPSACRRLQAANEGPHPCPPGSTRLFSRAAVLVHEG